MFFRVSIVEMSCVAEGGRDFYWWTVQLMFGADIVQFIDEGVSLVSGRGISPRTSRSG